MFHMFNKVYVKHDSAYKTTRKRIVVSQMFGHTSTMPMTLVGTESNKQPIAPLFQARTWAEMLDTYFQGSWGKFFSLLISLPASERVTVYCDTASMMEVLTVFWKTLFPGGSTDTYHTLRKLTLSYLLEGHASGAPSFIALDPTTTQQIRTEASSLYDEDATALWEASRPVTITRAQREEILKTTSVELQLATTLLDPDWRYGQVFRKKFVRMVQKQAVYDFTLDVKFHILSALYNFNEYEQNTSFNPETHSLEYLVAVYPQYAFLTDPHFHPDNTDYIIANYSLDDLYAVWKKTLHEGWSEKEYGYSLGLHLRDGLTFEQLIQHSLDNPKDHLPLTRAEYRERVNAHLINYILAAARIGDTTTLQSFVLR